MEVHPPSEPIHSWKDFFLHLATITIGLLIAVGIEGIVEWQHHRHLVHEAEASLNNEITRNAAEIPSIRKQIGAAQQTLEQDLDTLRLLLKDPNAVHRDLSLAFGLQSFDDVSWKTAQATGALSYMPIEDARRYSDIYGTQAEIFKVQEQEVDDVMQAASLVVTERSGDRMNAQTIDSLEVRIGLIQIRLKFLDSLVAALDRVYQGYKAKHTAA